MSPALSTGTNRIDIQPFNREEPAVSHPTQGPVSDRNTPGTSDVSDTVARTLRDTAWYLHRHGWVQGYFYDPSATVFTPAACLVGALGMVCYGGPVDAPALNYEDPGYAQFDAALSYLDVYLAGRWYAQNGYEFNDARGRTLAHVIAVLFEAATAWEHAADGDNLSPKRLACGCRLAMVLTRAGHRIRCPFTTVDGAA